MDDTYRIEQKGTDLVITLNPRTTLNKVLRVAAASVLFMLLIYLFCGMLIMDPVNAEGAEVYILKAIILAIAVVVFVVMRFMFRRSMHIEILTITNNRLIVLDDYFLSKTKRVFDLAKVKEMTLSAPPRFSQHPLSETSFTNVKAVESVVQSSITDGGLQMTYGERKIHLAKKVPSWDVLEVVLAIEKHTGMILMPDDVRSTIPKDEEEEY